MPLIAVENKRLYRQIADQIAALISRGEYGAGQRLPPERELAEKLGVSRPSVREALIALEVEGKVEGRVGSGVFVTQGKPSRAALSVAGLPEGEGPFELLQARIVIEGEVAAMAAHGASKADQEAIDAAVEELHRCQREGL